MNICYIFVIKLARRYVGLLIAPVESRGKKRLFMLFSHFRCSVVTIMNLKKKEKIRKIHNITLKNHEKFKTKYRFPSLFPTKKEAIFLVKYILSL